MLTVILCFLVKFYVFKELSKSEQGLNQWMMYKVQKKSKRISQILSFFNRTVIGIRNPFPPDKNSDQYRMFGLCWLYRRGEVIAAEWEKCILRKWPFKFQFTLKSYCPPQMKRSHFLWLDKESVILYYYIINKNTTWLFTVCMFPAHKAVFLGALSYVLLTLPYFLCTHKFDLHSAADVQQSYTHSISSIISHPPHSNQ